MEWNHWWRDKTYECLNNFREGLRHWAKEEFGLELDDRQKDILAEKVARNPDFGFHYLCRLKDGKYD